MRLVCLKHGFQPQPFFGVKIEHADHFPFALAHAEHTHIVNSRALPLDHVAAEYAERAEIQFAAGHDSTSISSLIFCMHTPQIAGSRKASSSFL